MPQAQTVSINKMRRDAVLAMRGLFLFAFLFALLPGLYLFPLIPALRPVPQRRCLGRHGQFRLSAHRMDSGQGTP
jgi:hypothetical protein